MDRSLLELLQVLRATSARDVRIARLHAPAARGGPECSVSTASHVCWFAISMSAASVVDEREAGRLEQAGAAALVGFRRPESAELLDVLWTEVRRAARSRYGDGCWVVCSCDAERAWHATVVGPPRAPPGDARPGNSKDELALYFTADGDDECGVLLEVAAFVGGSQARPQAS